MMIETSFTTFGEGPIRITEKTTNPRTIQVWGKKSAYIQQSSSRFRYLMV